MKRFFVGFLLIAFVLSGCTQNETKQKILESKKECTYQKPVPKEDDNYWAETKEECFERIVKKGELEVARRQIILQLMNLGKEAEIESRMNELGFDKYGKDVVNKDLAYLQFVYKEDIDGETLTNFKELIQEKMLEFSEVTRVDYNVMRIVK